MKSLPGFVAQWIVIFSAVVAAGLVLLAIVDARAVKARELTTWNERISQVENRINDAIDTAKRVDNGNPDNLLFSDAKKQIEAMTKWGESLLPIVPKGVDSSKLLKAVNRGREFMAADNAALKP